MIRRLLVAVVVSFSLLLAHPADAATTFVATASDWHYLDDGSDQGTAWLAPGFDASGWPSGNAQLGYGDGDEGTLVSFGPNPAAKYITTYFRKSFSISAAATYTTVTVRLIRDDGAIVYLNGAEVFRSNMPATAVTYLTPASSAVGGSTESQFFTASIDPALLLEGSNVLAVEVHQSSGSSSDVSFDLELTGSNGTVARGPYLQRATASSMTVHWRTVSPSDSRVRFGADPMSLTSVVDDPTVATEHVVTLSGLTPDTRYYYSVGTSSAVLAGGDADHAFVTAPLAGTPKKTRIWVLGDSGTADGNAAAVRDAFTGFAAATLEDLWLMLGDNAYNSGTDSEYQAGVFDMYPAQLRRSALWPTLGNHDAASADSDTESGVYFDIFDLPAAAEAGGVPSGTEAYYSFDYGNIHFVCLDSMESSRSPGSAMLTWLSDDLLATTADWVIAFWHHPPYSKGSHDSDSEIELVEMRQNVLPILEANGVDLVLAGHSHSYERSILLDAHYGASTTLTGSMIIDGGDGRVDGDGAYHKPTLGSAAHEGAVYVVAGSSGQISAASLSHPAMYVSLLSLGSLVLDVDHNVLQASFLDGGGGVADHFTLTKGGPLCGNGLAEAGEECDGSDLAGASCAAQGCSMGSPACSSCALSYAGCGDCALPTPTPTPASHHDAALVAVAPQTLTIASGATEEIRDLRFKVFNANLLPTKDPASRQLQVTVDSNDCPPTLIDGGPDFDLRAGGDQSSVSLAGGRAKKGRLQLRARAGDFSTHNSSAPTRCTLVLNVAVVSPGNDDPTPANNQVPVNISIVDLNDGAASPTHESTLAPLRPLRLKLSPTSGAKTKTVSLVMGNADLSPSAEQPGHDVHAELVEAESTCPAGAVVVAATAMTVPGGQRASVALTVTADGSAFSSANRRSPARCVAVIRAVTDVAANVEPDPSNNEIRLVIDVDDRHDY